MSDARPPTAYERFVAATRAILSVSKKNVEKDMRRLRRARVRRKNKKTA